MPNKTEQFTELPIVFRKECCYECKFSEAEETEEARVCHRYPPLIGHTPQNEGELTYFPVVAPLDWCGEFIIAAEEEIARRKEFEPLENAN